VHITGTKGKGSTAAMLASVLTAAGYKTGLYTSPHLLTFRERIRIGSKLISEAELADITGRLQPVIDEVNRRAPYGKITTFEILTALGFIYFFGKKADGQVLEVGLGGTYDATNVIKNPEVCVITSISYDHTEVLGNTLALIAGEKSGIIKPGCTVVSAPQPEEAAEVIRRICLEHKAKLIEVGKEVQWREAYFDITHQEAVVSGKLNDYEISIPLLGEHQLINAATAIAALEVLQERGFNIAKGNIVQGLAGVNWPGRFQIIGDHPLVILDGAHNPDSALKLRQTIEQYCGPKKIMLVIGASSDKDIAGIAAGLAPVVEKTIVTRAHNPRAMAVERIAAEFNKYDIVSELASDVRTALKRAVYLAGANGIVCATGSLFVVAEALERLHDSK
jgi:dihydrofolate synthase / folylpolyglutamate synthase